MKRRRKRKTIIMHYKKKVLTRGKLVVKGQFPVVKSINDDDGRKVPSLI